MLRDLSLFKKNKNNFTTRENVGVFLIIIGHFEENILYIGSTRAQMRAYKHFK